jgi:subtilisin family serine protease
MKVKIKIMIAVLLILLLTALMFSSIRFSSANDVPTVSSKFETRLWNKLKELKTEGITRQVSVIIRLNENPRYNKALITAGQFSQMLSEKHYATVEWAYDWALPWVVASVPVNEIEKVASYDFVLNVGYGETEVKPCLSTSKTVIKADSVVNYGYNGSGVKVAVIDTGIEHQHNAFLGKEIIFKDIGQNRSEVVKPKNYTGGYLDIYDIGGEAEFFFINHGTHCAGILAGSDPYNTSLWGVSPGVDELIIALPYWLEYFAGSYYLSCDVAHVVESVTWVMSKGAQVISMSLDARGSGPPCDGNCSLCQVVDWAADQGAVVVVAAGNSGPSAYSIGCPGAAQKAITVGAIDDNDSINSSLHGICSYSGRGPTGDGRTKPDVVAPAGDPGDIYSPEGGISYYQNMGGTSSATPHVAGVAALLLDANPTFEPLEVKQVIKNTANASWCPQAPYDENTQGSGLVDALQALTVGLRVETRSLEGALLPGVSFWVDDVGRFSPETVSVLVGEHTVKVDRIFLQDAGWGMYWVWTFQRWEDGSTNNIITVWVEANATLTAYYKRSKYPIGPW